jgi:hypothetical protein
MDSSMRRSYLFLALLALLTLLSASSAQAEIRKWRVEHYLQPAAGGGAGNFCYVISDGAAAQLIDQPIAGFAWDWGAVSQITVNVEQARAADGSIVKTYKLISVDSQSAVPEGTRFQMFLFDRSFIQGETLLGVKAFKCANAGVENELKRRLENLGGNGAAAGIPGAPPAGPAAKQRQVPEENRRVLLEFSHPKTSSEPLILQSVTGASDLGLE